MRIVVVSSHFPPNFVSGGTLVPFRLAEDLAARGHEVFVYAGRIDPHSPDLVQTEEVTESGLQITWTTCTAATEWAADSNYSNPGIDADFARYLQRVRPDVVHLHAIQGFGGGLVTVAKACGAVTVVTMHDLWWWCARQFLVDRDLRPCCIVPASGACPCERDNAWLRQRNTGLAEHLRNADWVLTPSEAMRQILIGNGVDPATVSVDENGAAQLDRAPARAEVGSAEDVRFVFAGGIHPLKGGPTLLAAATQLESIPGWQLTMYGWEGMAGSSDRIHFRGTYDATRVDRVLADHDVLVLPSLARESYSLITREALQTGLVVVTSNTPGPTEVIKDHHNGLVVPIGDAQALAAAMRQLIQDRDLLRRLVPAPGSGRTSSVGEQADRNLAVYHRLLDDRAATTGAPALPPIRRVLLVSGIGGAPLRYRGQLAQEGLALQGVRMDVHMYRDVEVPRLARTADALVLYRVPASEQILDVIAMVRNRPDPVPIIYDIDDLVVDPDLRAEIDPLLAGLEPIDQERYWQGVRRYRTTLEACDAYIGSTEMLTERIRELAHIPTYRWANGVGQLLARASDYFLRQPRKPGPVRFGYLSGTNTHNADWAAIEPAVLQVMRQRPEVELWLGGLLEVGPDLDEFRGRIKRMPFLPWYELPKVLRDLDINVAPLVLGGIFNEAKSAIKQLEAALVATPTIATPTQPFREAIRDGHTGLLAGTEQEWVRLLLLLIDDPALRATVGEQARQEVLLEYSAQRQGRRYLEILEQVQAAVAADGHREMFANFEPELVSEPYLLWAADSYEAPGWLAHAGQPAPGGTPRNWRTVAADYRVNAARSLREEGVLRTSRRAAGVATRLPRKVARRLLRS